MNITHEQLAELLAGIARSQQAVIDAARPSEGCPLCRQTSEV